MSRPPIRPARDFKKPPANRTAHDDQLENEAYKLPTPELPPAKTPLVPTPNECPGQW